MSPLEVGLVGAGGMAGVHLPAWVELGARVRVFSIDGLAPALAARYAEHGVTAVGSLDELLAGSGVVDVCTPTFTHKEIGLAAIAAGRHVVCEKPLALTVPDAAELVDAARDAGVMLFPAHVVRFFPEYRTMADAVAAGAVGTPAVLRFTRTGSYPVWSPWFADPALSGGILVDQMIHDYDFARLLAGEVVRVYAQAREQAGQVAAATAVLTHASGAVSHVHGVWALPGSPFRTSYRIAGPGGVLEHDTGRTEAFRIVVQRADRPGEGIPNTSLTESPYLTELRAFAAAFAGGPPPPVTAADGLAAVRIAAAARESAASHRAVELDAEEGQR
jgi:myo-inositol 2-dehydrogenase/D-chiro-inositol 1-dehydrogenase